MYVAGGDDSLLYYQFPKEMIQNYLFNIVSNNVLSGLGTYGAQWYMFPFYALIYLVKLITPFVNTQLLFYGINLGLGFLFFYSLLGIWIKRTTNYDFFIKISAGLFYVFSTFVFYSIWNAQLFYIYLVAIFPLALYLFIRGIQEGKPAFIVLDSILVSVFSILLLSLPLLVPLIITVIPLLSILFWRYKRRTVIYSVLFISLVFLLNFYWSMHTIYAPYSTDKLKKDIVSTTNLQETRKNNEYLIRAVSGHNQLVYPLFNLYHKQIQIDYNGSNLDTYINWHNKLLPFNLLFLVIILAGGMSLKTKNNEHKLLYLSLLTAWLITLYFFTVNIGNWGTNLFLWLTNNVPGFVMFRNMYSKIGLAMAFIYAFFFGVSCKLCFDSIGKESLKKGILLLAIAIIAINATPFIIGDFYNKPMWTTSSTYNSISGFNQDFQELTAYLKNVDGSDRILWLPLNSANYIQVRDKSLPDHYYSGVSPLQFLADKSDFNGMLSFGPFGKKLFELLILERKYQEVGQIYQKFNIKYIIVNNDITSDLQNSYLYSWYTPGDVYQAQGIKFKAVILGKKLADFGKRYSLYKINPQFDSEKIYLTGNQQQFPTDYLNVSYKKIASYEYRISIKNLKGQSNLVFLDPYHKQWELYFSKDKTVFVKGSHDVVFDYANGWPVDPEYIKKNFDKSLYKLNSDGSIDIELTLYFKPQSYFYPGLIVSGTTLFLCVGYLIISLVKRKRILGKPE